MIKDNRIIVLPFFAIMVVFFLFQCNQRTTQNTANVETIQIDVHKINKGYDLTAILDTTYSIIPLETNNDCLIGKIDKLEVKNERIFVTDFMSKSVYVFDMNGKYLSKVSAFGQGPGEYVTITASAITDSTIIIVDNMSLKQIEYSFNGKLIKENRMLDKVWAVDIFWHVDKLYYVNDGGEPDLGKFHLFSSQLFSDNIKKYLPYSQRPTSLGINGPQYGINRNNFLLIYSGIDDIFGLLPDGTIGKKYSVDFMNNKVVYRSNDEKRVFFENTGEKIIGIDKIFETDKYLFLILPRLLEFDITCIYNKEDKTTILVERCFTHRHFGHFCEIKAVIENKNQIVSWWQAATFKSVYQDNWSKEDTQKKTFYERITEADKSIDEEDNPVLIIYNLK